MFAHDLVDLLVGDLSAHLGHGVFDVLLRDLVVAVDVELPKDRLQLLMGQELLNTDRRREELRVVDQRVAVVVQLGDDLFEFLRADLVVVVHQGFFELLDLNEARVIRVDFLKQLSQILYIVRGKHLHKNVECGFLQSR